MDGDAFGDRLLPGERVVWSGHPSQGILFSLADFYLIPFSLFWAGFAVFWEFMATFGVMAADRSGAVSPPIFVFPLFGLPFVAIGLYLVVGRFIADAWLRRRIRYAVTNRRVLILRGGPFPNFTALALDRLPDLQVSEGRGGRGSIRFGQASSVWRGLGRWSPAMDPIPQFLAIDDARVVFNLVQRQQDA